VSVSLRVALVLLIPSLTAAAVIGRGPDTAVTLARHVEDLPGDASVPPSAAIAGTDLRGNDVTEAVATYKVDRTGSLYELHSPGTEVAHLKPPTS
jgi:hypothetical protein